MSYNKDNMYKLPAEHRFFDINNLWPVANQWVVRQLYPLPVTANQITFLSLMAGILSAGFYLIEGYTGLVGGSAFLYGKLYLDNVDGNLARVRGETSRLGRFFDSITDFVVTILVFTTITNRLVEETGDHSLWFLGLSAMFSALIHCSYFVFYLVRCTSRVGSYKKNRSDESVTEEDEAAYKKKEPLVYFMQKLHVWVYGWQDCLVASMDGFSQKLAGVPVTPAGQDAWYTNKHFLSLTGPLCLCTNNMAIVVFSLFNKLAPCFILIVGLGNLYLAALTGWKIVSFKFNSPEETNSAQINT